MPENTPVVDQATVAPPSGSGYPLGGTVTYTVYSDSACTTAVGSGDTVTVTDGSVPASNAVTLALSGTYYWQASYSGALFAPPSASTCGPAGEVETVTAPLCPTGLTPHVLNATYGTNTFTGLFCVNAAGDGTYTQYSRLLPESQQTLTGTGHIRKNQGVTSIQAYMPAFKNLNLVGSTNGTVSSFGESGSGFPHLNGTFTLSLPLPTITTTQLPPSATVCSPIADKATVSGGYNPTGTVTFALYDNPNATGTPLFTDTESLVGDTATSADYTTWATGTDYWVVTYNGDANDNPVTSGTAAEPVTINPPSGPVLCLAP